VLLQPLNPEWRQRIPTASTTVISSLTAKLANARTKNAPPTKIPGRCEEGWGLTSYARMNGGLAFKSLNVRQTRGDEINEHAPQIDLIAVLSETIAVRAHSANEKVGRVFW